MHEIVVSLGNKDMTQQVQVSFYVEDLPKLSSGWPKNYSRWTSQSALIGKGLTGQYWVSSLQLPTCADRELSHLQCDHRPLSNPVAFFADTGEALPFLILYGFDVKAGAWRYGDKFFRDKLNRIEALSWASRAGLDETDRLRQELLKRLQK